MFDQMSECTECALNYWCILCSMIVLHVSTIIVHAWVCAQILIIQPNGGLRNTLRTKTAQIEKCNYYCFDIQISNDIIYYYIPLYESALNSLTQDGCTKRMIV